MKKLFILIFFIFLEAYICTALKLKNCRPDSQTQFLEFIEACHKGFYSKAFIITDIYDVEKYKVTFFAQNSQDDYVVQETKIILPFDNYERQRHFSDLVSSCAATHSSSTSQAVGLIAILLGKKSGKIEFNKDIFKVLE